MEARAAGHSAGSAGFWPTGSPTALEALIREIRRRAKDSTRTTVVLQTLFENRAHPVVGQDGKEPADRAASP